nr:GAF domain-containing protein [Actinomadura madurae]
MTALVAQRAQEITDADLAIVMLVEEGGPEFVVEAAHGQDAEQLAGARVPLDQSLAGQVFTDGVALRLADGDRAAREANLPTQKPIGPFLVVPLGLGESRRGVISVVNAPGGTAFSEGTQRLLEAFAARPPWPWSWPSGAGMLSGWCCWRTATGSPKICTTPSSSGCSRPRWA